MLIGTTVDNAPIYLCSTAPESLPEGSKVLGCIRGGFIVQSPPDAAAAAGLPSAFITRGDSTGDGTPGLASSSFGRGDASTSSLPQRETMKEKDTDAQE